MKLSLRFTLLLALCSVLNFSTAFAAVGPIITATQDDGTPAATRKAVGDTITYTTTISNTATVVVGSTANDATGVMLTNPTPANTTDTGSVSISPIAFDDVYPQTVIANIGINSANIPYNVFANDYLGSPATAVIDSFTQPAHGAVTMVTSGANTGQFTYQPTAGYTGADSFTYTISNAVGSSVGTVNLTVAASPIIWFVNPALGSNGTGTLASPFNNMASAVTAIGTNTGQRIFIFSGTATTGVPLKSNGWLIGQGVLGTNFDTVMGITPGSGANPRPAINGTRPTIGVTSGTGVTLADGNNVQGLNVTNTNGSGITGSAVGTLTLADFDVTVTGGSALSLTTSGTVTATGSNNNLTTTTGTALNVANVTIGAANLTFKSISSNGGANGIILDTTGSSGGLTVTGTVGSVTRDNSGGTIQNKTGTDGTASGHGIYLNSTTNVSLNHMNILGNQGDGIHGNSVTGFNLTYTSMATNGTTTAQLGNFHGEGDVNFVTLSGAATIDHNDFQSAYYNTFGVFNDVTAVSLNRIVMTSNSFGANNTTGGNAGVVFRAQAGTMNVTFGSSAATANTITGAGSNTFIMDLHGTVSADLIMKNNAISNNHPNIVTGGGGVSLQSGGAGDQVNFTFNVDSNTFSGSHGAGFFIGTGQVTNVNTFTGTFNNNTIGIQGTANSGSTTGNDLFIDNEGGITNINVTNNKLYQYNPNGTGALQLQVANDNGHEAHATCVVTGNTISNPGTNASGAGQTFNGIQLNAGTAAGDTAKTNLTLFGNTVAGSGNAATGSADIRLRQRFSATIGLFGNGSNYAGTPNDTTAIANFAVAQNGGTGSAVSASPGGFFGTARFLLLAPGGVERLSAGDTSTSASNTLRRVSASPASVLRAAANVQDHPATADHAVSIANAPLAQSELDSIVTAARERWAATGLTSEQLALLRRMKFEAADLPGLHLGEANRDQIRVDTNAGGNGWFVGSDDEQFATSISGNRRYTDPSSAPAGRIDLLTTIMHEMGHALGLPDSYAEQDRDNLMYGYLTKGERRLPAKDQAKGIVPNGNSQPHFLSTPVNIGTLPPNKSVKIVYSVTVGPISGNPQQTYSQGTVSGNFTSVMTDDPTVGGATDQTVTLFAIPPAITSANSTTFTVGTTGNFNVTANGAPLPSFSTSGLPSGVTLTSAGLLSGNPASGTGGTYSITITASNGIAPAAMQTFTLTVNQPPAITTANNTTFTVGTNGNFQLTASGFPTTYTFTNTGNALPSGVTLSASGLLSGIPAAGTGGLYNLTFTVSNGIAPNGTQSFTLTVNQAPAITSASTTTFTKGTAGTFTVIATGYPTPTINLTSGSLPAGVNYAAGMGNLAGTPTVFGTFPLTFTASNGVGSNVVQSFSLVVNPSAQDVKSGPSISGNPTSGFQLSFIGNPGTQYTVQFAPSLPALPAVPDWQTLSLQTASASGMFSAPDNPPAGTTQRFYRAIIP